MLVGEKENTRSEEKTLKSSNAKNLYESQDIYLVIFLPAISYSIKRESERV